MVGPRSSCWCLNIAMKGQQQQPGHGHGHGLEYNKAEVSSVVIKAYVVSLLLLLSVLVWSLGDAWVLYAHDVVFMPAYRFASPSSSSSSS